MPAEFQWQLGNYRTSSSPRVCGTSSRATKSSRTVRRQSHRTMSLLRPVDRQQQVLFDWPRDLKAGLRNGFPPPPDPQLEAAFHQLAREHARRFGWSRSKAERVQRGVRVMLAIQDTPGAAIRRSDVLQLSRIKHSAATVADVIAAAGMLDDDIAPPVVRWFDANTRDLPEPMHQELAVWLEVMMLGSATAPRRNPRSHTCINNYIRWALPTLCRWAEDHDSLREIGRDDVANIVRPPDCAARLSSSRSGPSSRSSKVASWSSSTRARG